MTDVITAVLQLPAPIAAAVTLEAGEIITAQIVQPAAPIAATITVAGPAGPQGPAGPPSTSGSGTSTKTAAVDLSGHRVVTSLSDGTVTYASNTDLATASKPLWLTTGAALAGTDVTVVGLGDLTEPSWNWTPGLPIFLGMNGVLTQTPPTLLSGAAFLQQVASAESATALYFNPRTPIVLS